LIQFAYNGYRENKSRPCTTGSPPFMHTVR
jgi:hypothetical protein